MSRSNPIDEVKNPSKRFYEWNGESACFKYYDKEKEEKVEVPLPFTFMVLDQLSTVKGWNDASESGIFSNEVRNLKKEVINVRAFKGGNIASGLYAEIKDRVKAEGGKFTSSVYIAVKNEDGKLEIANLQLSGAAVNAWMDFKKRVESIYSGAVTVKGFTEGKKGSVTFKMPEFKQVKITPETDAEAKVLDEKLQGYFKVYFSTPVDPVDSSPDPHGESTHIDDNQRYIQDMTETAKRQSGVQYDEFSGQNVEADDFDEEMGF
jgi:hypothetical protein